MRFKLILIALALGTFPLKAQRLMLDQAFGDFAVRRLKEYEPINVPWNMPGMIQANLNEGMNNLMEGEYGIAVADFTKVLDADSTLWHAYYFRAAAQKYLRNFDEAEKDLQRALESGASKYEVYVELAKVAYLHKLIDDSEHYLKKAVQENSTKPIAYYLKGDINLDQGQKNVAIRNYKECLEVDSLFHDARIKLAILDLVNKGDADAALSKLNKILGYDSLQKTALIFRGILSSETNKEQSIKDLTRLLQVSPYDRFARYIRGVIFTQLSEYDKAFSDFREVIESGRVEESEFSGDHSWIDKRIDIQNVGAYTLTRVYGLSDADATKIKRAYCHIIIGEYDKSMGAINQVTNAPQEPLCLYLLAVTYEHKGDHPRALHLYDMSLKIDNDIADAHKKRGIYAQKLKQWDLAIQDFNEVIRISPDAIIAYKHRGMTYVETGKYSEAIADLNKYLDRIPDDRVAQETRGIAFRETNQRLNAYIDLVRSVEWKGENFKELAHLIDSVMTKGDTTLAYAHLKSVLKVVPEFSEGFARKFKIDLKRNELKSFEKEIKLAMNFLRADVNTLDRSFLLTMQGVNFSKSMQNKEALDSFNQALLFDKKNATAYFERGKVYKRMGQKSKAKNDFQMAASLGNKQAQEMAAMKD